MTIPNPNTVPNPPPAPPLTALPPSTLPTLHLTHPTLSEKLGTWTLNGDSWRGALQLPVYLRREVHLASQSLTADGGLSYWILVDSAAANAGTTSGPESRTILASCESLRKRALIARRGQPAQEVICHSVGSVFCRKEFRGLGFAGRMLEELRRVLEHWQQEDTRAPFTVLYSDIGKKFYAKLGWKPFSSAHVALPPANRQDVEDMGSRPLFAQDLDALCEADGALMAKYMARFEPCEPSTRVAIIADAGIMQWHHAREEFVAKETLDRIPEIKGAIVGNEKGARIWAVWTRTFGGDKRGNTLHILRLVIEEEDDFNVYPGDENEKNRPSVNRKHVQAAAAVLRAAQVEAARWQMDTVEIWNPSATVVASAREVLPLAKITYRDEESVASLMWYGDRGGSSEDVQWVRNEKYAWS